jgi:NADP-dependent 3-hydroxy acid dehydrogenase YdfG
VRSEKGCRAVVADNNLLAFQETTKEINARGGNWDDIVVFCDTDVLKVVGPWDILVNNAGLMVMQSFMTNTQKEIERTTAVNVNGVIYVRNCG